MDNKTSKYFKYAIGEILLVMIGILLALQVNNWNEQRKAQIKEVKLAHQLLEDAIADSIFFESRKYITRSRDTVYARLINLGSKIPNDSLVSIEMNFRPKGIFVGRFAYQSNLVGNNPDAYDAVTNDSLKTKLRAYFAKYDYVAGAIELSNRTVEKYGVDLAINNDNDLSRLGDSVTYGDLDFIYTNNKTLAIIKQFSDLGQNHYREIDEFLIINSALIEDLKSYLKVHQ